MAWQVSKRVWDSIKTEDGKKKGIDASERLMLLALADKADEQGICWPKHDTSYQTLGDMVGVNRRSAMRLVESLSDMGHLWKSETVGRGHSNFFIVAIGLSEVEVKERLLLIGVTDNTINNEEKVLQEAPIKEPEKEMVLPVTQNGVTDDTNKEVNGVTGNTQSYLINPSSPTINNEDSISEKSLSPSQKMFAALAEVCRCNINLMRGQLNKVEKELREAGVTPETIKAFGEWWYSRDFRGKQDQPPTLKQVKETLGQFEALQSQAASVVSAPKAEAIPEPDKTELTPAEKVLVLFKELAAERIPAPQWREHIAPMRVIGCPNGKIQVEVNRFTKELIENRFNKVLEPIALKLNPEGGFEYVVI